MTIEEKAKDYSESEWNGSYESRDSFEEGAKWMLEKAEQWFTGYLAEIGYPDDWLRNSKAQQSGMERFIKAMEE